MRDFGRVVTAMVTPMGPGLEVDYSKAGELARRLAGSGSDAIVVFGTTGESPTLGADEKIRLLETVLEAVGDRVTVIAGTGSNCTASSVELSRRAAAAGAHGLMAVVPYYNKPPQEGLYRHFKAVVEATELPLMIYNVPGRTGTNLLPETLLRLAELPNVVAVKEASGNLDQVSAIAAGAPRGFRIYSGDDSLTLPILAVGGHGVVSVASHVAGREIAEMISAHVSGEAARAAELHARLMPLFKVLFVTTNPIPVKAALRLAGFDTGGLRPPLVEAGPAEVEAIRRVMGDLGLLAA